MATIRDAVSVNVADVEADWLAILHDPNASLATADKKLVASALPLTSRANTFTALQTFSAGVVATGACTIGSYDNGTGAGPYLYIGRNNNATTPAPGHVHALDKNAVSRYLWIDSSGIVRTHTAAPTSTDTGGTVVGTQTSSLDSKIIAGEPLPAAQILAAVQAGAEAVRRFTYRSGSFNGEEFSGVVVDYAPRYGMDRDEDHPAGKSLNVATVIGDLLIAVANLAQRVEALEAAHA